MRTDDDVRQAIGAVRRSRHSAGVQAYSRAKGMEGAHDLAVVVQQFVPAELAGVLFTADPLTGSRSTIIGNLVHGLGEQLVSGEADGLPFTLRRPRGGYDGPPELRRFAGALYRLANRLERHLGAPQDVEWAIAGGKLLLLQSRPITTLRGHNTATGAWNDSLTGDYLWTNSNFGEAVPDVMTPCTWSLLQIYMAEAFPATLLGNYPFADNIGGRFYMNVSLVVSVGAALGPLFGQACQMLQAGTSRFENGARGLRSDLERLVGHADANALMSGLSDGPNHLASLGPLLGLRARHHRAFKQK